VNNISSTIYQTIVRFAEGGTRVTRIELPPSLYEEYYTDQGMPQMMRTLKVQVVQRDVKEPRFLTEGES
jgi:hypothetical protein